MTSGAQLARTTPSVFLPEESVGAFANDSIDDSALRVNSSVSKVKRWLWRRSEVTWYWEACAASNNTAPTTLCVETRRVREVAEIILAPDVAATSQDGVSFGYMQQDKEKAIDQAIESIRHDIGEVRKSIKEWTRGTDEMLPYWWLRKKECEHGIELNSIERLTIIYLHKILKIDTIQFFEEKEKREKAITKYKTAWYQMSK